MYKRVYSLKSKYLFSKVLKYGKNFSTQNLIILYLKKENTSKSIFIKRFGIITSNKLTKKKVIQNKIRRIIATIIRLNLDRFQNNFYYVFIPKKNLISTSLSSIKNKNSKNDKICINYEDINTQINSFLSKVDLFR